MEFTNKDFSGFFRAVVIDNKDEDMQGKVQVWIPDLMPEVSQDKGLWALPANNPLGGLNDEYSDDHIYMGTSYIPKKGSQIFVFFENNDPTRVWYFGSCNLENTKVLPENQVGNEKEHKWVIFKSHEGRCVVISDDPDDRRVEITGKKREISNPPVGDKDSVYNIDGNQSTILFDERDGKEKILLRTHKGDYLHIDVDEQKLQTYFKSDILLQTDGDFHVTVGGDTLFEAKGDMNIKSKNYKNETGQAYNVKSGSDQNYESGGNLSTKASSAQQHKAGTSYNMQSGGAINNMAGGMFAADGAGVALMEGVATPATPSTADTPDTPDEPEGERDT